jgi:hypothetical protein
MRTFLQCLEEAHRRLGATEAEIADATFRAKMSAGFNPEFVRFGDDPNLVKDDEGLIAYFMRVYSDPEAVAELRRRRLKHFAKQ